MLLASSVAWYGTWLASLPPEIPRLIFELRAAARALGSCELDENGHNSGSFNRFKRRKVPPQEPPIIRSLAPAL